MYSEEKIIKGMLYYRSSPNGSFVIRNDDVGVAVNQILSMPEERRMEVFRRFCTYCGSSDTRCQCWNDE